MDPGFDLEPIPPALQQHLDAVESARHELMSNAERFLRADGGLLYPLDLLVTAVADRAVALLSGFCRMVRERNLVTASAIVRLQVDTAARLFAASIAPDPHEFAVQVLAGERIDKLRDRHGRRMTDRFLVTELASRSGCAWIPDVYEQTCGYVHLSSKHFHHTARAIDSDARRISFKISALDRPLDDPAYIEVTQAFAEVTRMVGAAVRSWAQTKEGADGALPSKEAEQPG